jgi:putative membrane protein
MQKIIKLLLVFSMICSVGISVRADTNSGNSPKIDSQSKQATNSTKVWGRSEIEKFVKKAAQGGLFEVLLGDTARQRANTEQVRDFANLMVIDHNDANQKLKNAIQNMDIKIPAGLEKKYLDILQNLGKKTGSDFDKEYMNLMVKDHKEDVNEFIKAEKNLPAGALKSWVSNTLPVIKRHLTIAEGIKESQKSKQ